jgi:hypothetical protein
MQFSFANYAGPLEGDHTNLAMCAFLTHTDRRRRPHGKNRDSILRTLEGLGYTNTPTDSNNYFSQLPAYKFVFSPEGNGVDCHRHYEALIAGAIPVVERCEIINWKYGDCPILYTDDYSECTPAYLEAKYTEMLDATWDFSKLFLSYYTDARVAEIRRNGNYWGQRTLGRSWYTEST